MTMLGLACNNESDEMNKPCPLGWSYLSLKLFDPGLSSLECVGVGDIIDDDGGLCTPVVHRGEAVPPLLARRVPDLKLGNIVMI